MRQQETIAAIATAFGNAAVGIVRISGEKSLNILRSIFNSEIKTDFSSHKMYLGKILSKDKEIIDEAMVAFFKGPNSFTGEDSAEIYCHGGYITVKKVLDIVLKSGARLANPGEFTERAFLNGRIDLVQAEAIADIVYAQSEKAQSIAQNQLAGSLGSKIKKILKEVLDVYSHLSTQIDFPDEDVEEISKAEIKRKLGKPVSEISDLLKTSEKGLLYKNGVKVSIVGLPNAGKSSLLNALVKDSRAIVTDIPGTTRDILESTIELDGILFRLFDTAGITETEDVVEKEGVKRAMGSIKEADIVLLVVENYQDMDEFFSHVNKKVSGLLERKNTFLVKSKEDVKKEETPSRMAIKFTQTLKVSAKKLSGIKEVERLLLKQIKKDDSQENILVTSIRQKELLENIKKSLDRAVECVNVNDFEDKILIELDYARRLLEEIIGQDVSSGILNKVFSRFCVGK